MLVESVADTWGKLAVSDFIWVRRWCMLEEWAWHSLNHGCVSGWFNQHPRLHVFGSGHQSCVSIWSIDIRDCKSKSVRAITFFVMAVPMLSLSTWQLLTQPLIDVSRHAHHAFGGRARTRMQITCPQPTDREWTANPLLHLWYIKGTFWRREKLWRPPSLWRKVFSFQNRWKMGTICQQYSSQVEACWRHCLSRNVFVPTTSSSFSCSQNDWAPYFEYWNVSCSGVTPFKSRNIEYISTPPLMARKQRQDS